MTDPHADILAPIDDVLAKLGRLCRNGRCLIQVDEMVDLVLDARRQLAERLEIADLERQASL